MTGKDIEARDAVLTGEIIESDEEYLAIVYANLGVEEALDAYLDRDSDTGEQDVEALLESFSATIASVAWKEGAVDTEIVRFAFDHLTASMNEVASARFGYERPETSFQAVLHWLGVGREPRRYVRPMDDRYWSQQFMDQYENGGLPIPDRHESENDQEYLARYTHGSMRGFLFAPFTYLG
jgi:hypothetical protein